MTWFYVDDKFWSHPKTIGISTSAAGVWVLAGTWCMAHLTDGYIPADALTMVCRRKPTKEAAELVDRDLWAPTFDGWQYVDWLQWQKSKEVIEGRRAAAKARQEAWRAKRRGGV